MKKILLWTLMPLAILLGIGYYLTFVQHTGYFHNMLMTELSQEKLNNILKELELHKVKYKKYPDSLSEINKALEKEAGPMSFPLYDPMLLSCTDKMQKFYYEKVDSEHYYLLGLGCDLTLFTDDDLLPNIAIQNYGFQVHASI